MRETTKNSLYVGYALLHQNQYAAPTPTTKKPQKKHEKKVCYNC